MKMNRIGTMRMVENRMVDPQALAVHYGVPQQLADWKKTEKAAYAETERRLYAMRALRARVEDAREELAELEGLGIEALREHSPRWCACCAPACALTRRRCMPCSLRRCAAGLRRMSASSSA